MADTITEFLNVAGLNFNDLTAGVQILENTETETAVIRDVVVNNPNSRSVNLMVGPAVVANANSTGRLSGTELVGADTTVIAKNGSVPMFNKFTTVTWPGLAAPTSLTSYVMQIDTSYSTDSLAAAKQGRGNRTSIINGPAPTVFPDFNCFNSNGDFFYATMRDYKIGATTNGDSTPTNSPAVSNQNYIYKRAGGVAGAETTVVTLANGYPGTGGQNSNTKSDASAQSFFFDADTDKIYGFYFPSMYTNINANTAQTGVIFMYDTISNTYTSAVTPGITASTLNRRSHSITAIDGYIFLNMNSVIYIIKASTLTVLGSYSGSGMNYSANAQSNSYDFRGSIAVGKNDQGEFVVIYHSDSGVNTLQDTGNNSYVFIAMNFGIDLEHGIPTPIVTYLNATTFGLSSAGNVFGYLAGQPSGPGTNTYNGAFSGRWTRVKQNSALLSILANSYSSGANIVFKVLNVNTLTIYNLAPRAGLVPVQTNATFGIDPSLAFSDYGTVDLRVTGIKTTQ